MVRDGTRPSVSTYQLLFIYKKYLITTVDCNMKLNNN